MILVSAIGYALVGVLFTVLAILLVTTWRGHRPGIYLITACLINAVWGFLLAWTFTGPEISSLVVFMVEVARTGSWVVFLTYLVSQIGIDLRIRAAALGICTVVVLSGFWVWASARWFGGTGGVGQVLFPGGLAIALTGLLLIEQLYRNSPVGARWGLKTLVLGLGGIFAYDLFLYSQAMLFSTIDATTWAARGAVNVLFVPAIAIAARRNPDWALPIFVSRHVVFYTTTLVAVGAYLLLMSLGGYLLIQFGGSWGALARVVFFTGAVLVLLFLLFSSTMRARLRVFLNKHFFHNKFDYREEWMRLIDTLAGFQDSSTREVAIQAVAQVVESPAGVLWVYSARENKFLFDARYEYDQDVPDLAPDDELLTFIRKDHWIVDLAEFEREPGRYQGLEFPDWVKHLNRPWLFVPLMLGEELLGLMMLERAPGPPKLNYEDRDLLKTIGNHVAVHLAQARSERLLTEAHQFEAFNKLTAFLMHDLKNLIAQQSLIVSNAEQHKDNPEFVDDAISTIAGSVERMKNVITQLKRGGSYEPGKQIELRFLASTAVDRCSSRLPVPRLVLNDADAFVRTSAEECIMVLTHLIRNAQEATTTEGEVTVELDSAGDEARVIIRDNGSGMSPDFIRERLFRPFESTKGSGGMGIGAYQAREFARNYGGRLDVSSEPGKGTSVTLSLPKVRV
jgi:putative PEP-CTERM system histidine kinase